MDTETMWDTLRTIGISEETILTVVAINGDSEQTYEDILYVSTGLRTFDQLEEEQNA